MSGRRIGLVRSGAGVGGRLSERLEPHLEATARLRGRLRVAPEPPVRGERFVTQLPVGVRPGAGPEAPTPVVRRDVRTRHRRRLPLVIVDDGDRRPVKGRLRDVVYDATLEFGPVVVAHVLSRSRFEQYREQEHPFVRRTLREAVSYV